MAKAKKIVTDPSVFKAADKIKDQKKKKKDMLKRIG